MLVSLYKALKASQPVWIRVLYFAASNYYIKIKCYELGQRLVLISILSSSSKIVLHTCIVTQSGHREHSYSTISCNNVGTLVCIHVHYYTCTYSASSLIFFIGMQQLMHPSVIRILVYLNSQKLAIFHEFHYNLHDGGHLVM